MIVQIGPHEWALLAKSDKRVLGKHRSKREAKAQEAAISISKARRAGHYIPKKRSRSS